MPLRKDIALTRLLQYAKANNLTKEHLNQKIGIDWSGSKWTRNSKVVSAAVVSDEELILINNFLELHRYSDEVGEFIEKIKSQTPSHMYFSLLEFFNYNYETEVETKHLAEGLYTLYRPSMKIPDMFTVGMVEIIADPKTHALRVKETRIFKGDKTENGEVDFLKRVTKERGIKEIFEGYMIRKRRRYICIQRSVNQDSPNFVISIYNDEFVDNEGVSAKILSLGGVGFGTVGSRMYVSKVFLERCDPGMTAKDMEGQLDYIQLEELKPSVKNYLRLISPNEFFHIF